MFQGDGDLFEKDTNYKWSLWRIQFYLSCMVKSQCQKNFLQVFKVERRNNEETV